MHNEMKNYKKLKVRHHLPRAIADSCTLRTDSSRQEIYNATLEVRSAIPHPRTMGVIRECGGKMWMGESKSTSGIVGQC